MRNSTRLLCISFCFIALPGFSQITKGAVFLGGDLGVFTSKTTASSGDEINKYHTISISPVVGKAIKENLVLGWMGNFGFVENDNNGAPQDQKINTYSLGVFVRKYQVIGKSGFSIFLQGDLSGKFLDSRYFSPPDYRSHTKSWGTGIAIRPGISYTVSKRLQLESGFNNLLYLEWFSQRMEVKSQTTEVYKTKGINLLSSLNNPYSSLYLGFRLLLGGK